MNNGDGWLVWNPQATNPRQVHDSEESARTEAARLAKSAAGTRFYVLRIVASCVHDSVQWDDHERGGREIHF